MAAYWTSSSWIEQCPNKCFLKAWEHKPGAKSNLCGGLFNVRELKFCSKLRGWCVVCGWSLSWGRSTPSLRRRRWFAYRRQILRLSETSSPSWSLRSTATAVLVLRMCLEPHDLEQYNLLWCISTVFKISTSSASGKIGIVKFLNLPSCITIHVHTKVHVSLITDFAPSTLRCFLLPNTWKRYNS